MFNNRVNMKASEENLSANNIIGKETHFKGDIETFGNIRIEGKVTGKINTKSKIALGEFSIVDGTIFAKNAEIAGELKGEIEISETLVLKPTARVRGKIKTKILIVDEGAVFDGGCRMLKEVKGTKIIEAMADLTSKMEPLKINQSI